MVARHNDVGVRVVCQQGIDVVVNGLRLRFSLVFTRLYEGLRTAKHGGGTKSGGEVVVDHRDGVAIEIERADQGNAAACEGIGIAGSCR